MRAIVALISGSVNSSVVDTDTGTRVSALNALQSVKMNAPMFEMNERKNL